MNIVFDLIACTTITFIFWYVRTLVHELGHVIALCITKIILYKEYKYMLDIKLSITFREGLTASKLLAYLANSNQAHIAYKANKTYLPDCDITDPKHIKSKFNIRFDKFIVLINFVLNGSYLKTNPCLLEPDVKSSKYRHLIQFNHISGTILELILVTTGVLLELVPTVKSTLTAYIHHDTVHITLWTSIICVNLMVWIVELILFPGQKDFRKLRDPNSFRDDKSKFEQPFSKKNRVNNLLCLSVISFFSFCLYAFISH